MKRLMNTDKINILLRERIKDRKTTFQFNNHENEAKTMPRIQCQNLLDKINL